jgi:hypothetical protein
LIPIVPTPEPLSLAISAATSLLPKVISSLGKSPTQKNAEYELSRMANEIEKAMDLNWRFFRAGYISQGFCLENYEYLWGLLVQSSQAAMSISPAQATRQITDRDYGGQFAPVWRGMFRDSFVISFEDYKLQNGYVLPDYQESFSTADLKYGAAGTGLINLPATTELATVAGSAGGLSRLPAPIKLAGLGLLGFLGWRFFR